MFDDTTEALFCQQDLFTGAPLRYTCGMIRHILFDLDGTLYSARYGLEDNVVRRLLKYLSRYLGISGEEAAAARRELVKSYGTTLEWLMAEKGFTAVDDYMEYLHPEDEADSLVPDPELRRFLEGLPCPCSILTNSPLFHAERIIGKLALHGIFHRVFDIKSNNLKGKPASSAYLSPLDVLGLKPEEVLFVDDVPRYAEGFSALGGRGILFDENSAFTEYSGGRVTSLFELPRFLGA